jgi:hypothetical protein
LKLHQELLVKPVLSTFGELGFQLPSGKARQ